MQDMELETKHLGKEEGFGNTTKMGSVKVEKIDLLVFKHGKVFNQYLSINVFWESKCNYLLLVTCYSITINMPNFHK